MSEKPIITLYTSSDCSLCEKAREMLKNISKKSFNVREINIDGNPELENYLLKVPVIELGNWTLNMPFEERELKNLLKRYKNSLLSRKIYERNSRFYDFYEKPMELIFLCHLRTSFFKMLKGFLKRNYRILEVGIGTGKNIPFYPEGYSYFGIDLSRGMLIRAKKNAHLSGVFLSQMDAQALAFPAQSFDIIFTTFVFCSVSDAVTGLKEIHRVLKENGRLFMMEHIRSEVPVIGKIMDFLDPLTLHIFGFHINRRTKENLQKAGFRVIERRKIGGILRFYEGKRESP